MTNQQIIITIVAALISTFAKFIFEKILGPYIPEKKILSSYIKNFFLFILRYALPIGSIIYAMIKTIAVDKFFVLIIVSNFFALAVNITLYFVSALLEIHKLMRLTTNSILDIMPDLQKFLISTNERIKKLEDALSKE